MERTLGVGIVGAGFIGELHAQAIGRVAGLTVAAATRRNRAELSRFCSAHHARAHDDYRQLIEDPDVHIVVVATPHDLHTDVAVEAARAGKALLVEKPLASNLEDCDRIVEAVSLNHVPATVGFVNRYAPAYQTAWKLLENGELGEPVTGVSTMAKFWMESNRRDWHLDPLRGGGMWMTAGIHCLDRLTWLMGSAIRSVDAGFMTRFHRQAADDTGVVFVRYENGCIGTVLSVGYRRGAPRHFTEIQCTDGTLHVDYAGVSTGIDETWKEMARYDPGSWMLDALELQWRTFQDSIRTGSRPPVTVEYSRHIMAAAFAAERSSREGREINV
ncbi:Gfo/Idh/MocA family protein [Salinispira pacifica]